MRACLWFGLILQVYSLSSSSPPDLHAFPKYRIDLTRDLISNASASSLLAQVPSPGSPQYELLRTATGQAFLCSIPSQEEEDEDISAVESENDKTLTAQQRKDQRQVDLQVGTERGLALLESLKGTCLYQRHGCAPLL